MTTIETIWLELKQEAQNSPIKEGAFRLRRTSEDASLDIYAGIDGSGFALIAIGLHQRPASVTLKSSALQCFRRQRADKTWLQVLRLELRGLESVFGRLCQDLLDEALLVQSEKALEMLFSKRLQSWQKLFERTDNGLLSIEKIKGMIAELSSMEDLIAEGKDSLVSIAGGWMGPIGHDQDFCLPGRNLEIKAVTPTAQEVSISSLRQLESEPPLFLKILFLQTAPKETPSAINLNKLVSRLEGKLSPDKNALKIFRERALEGGYLELAEYDAFNFLIVERRTYVISDNFPRLTSSMVTEAISKACYNIRLASVEDFLISVSQSDE